MENNDARGDDGHIAKQDNMSERDVAVLVHHSRNHVRPSRAAPCREPKSDTGTHENTAHNSSHEFLVGEHTLSVGEMSHY